MAADTSALGPLGSLALAFLVSERRRPVTREELADVYGARIFRDVGAVPRSVISRVRRRLEAAGLTGDIITGSRGCYELRLPATTVVDVEQATTDLTKARDALARRDAGAALRLARAAAEVTGQRFLPGGGGLWAERRQAKLDDLRLDAPEILSDASTAAGDHTDAIAAAEAVIAASRCASRRTSGPCRPMPTPATEAKRCGPMSAADSFSPRNSASRHRMPPRPSTSDCSPEIGRHPTPSHRQIWPPS